MIYVFKVGLQQLQWIKHKFLPSNQHSSTPGNWMKYGCWAPAVSHGSSWSFGEIEGPSAHGDSWVNRGNECPLCDAHCWIAPSQVPSVGLTRHLGPCFVFALTYSHFEFASASFSIRFIYLFEREGEKLRERQRYLPCPGSLTECLQQWGRDRSQPGARTPSGSPV